MALEKRIRGDRGWRVGGVKKMDKQSDQRPSLRKKRVQSKGKEGDEREEKKQSKEGCGLEKLLNIVSSLL